jgi:hypothetical protein
MAIPLSLTPDSGASRPQPASNRIAIKPHTTEIALDDILIGLPRPFLEIARGKNNKTTGLTDQGITLKTFLEFGVPTILFFSRRRKNRRR